MSDSEPLLSIRGLRVEFDVAGGRLPAVGGVDLDLAAGEVVAIVGESGSGKSALSMSLAGLNRGPRAHISGTATLRGQDLIAAGEDQLRQVRGKDIAVVFQDALAALNPTQRIGAQIAEMVRAHQKVSRKQAWARAVDLLREVGIANPEQRAKTYPHQLSGGMRQRVMIAIGLANEPALLIADEPTTALDVTIQAQVLRLLKRLQTDHGTTVVLITHDLGVVAEVADRVAVMYAGRIVEQGTRDQVLFAPQHPYTRALLSSVPRIDGPAQERLPAIAGNPLTGVTRPPGCAFAPRCDVAHDACVTETPALTQRYGRPGQLDACVLGPDREKVRVA
ncbi:ABC transporter ATP-binding protein [Actinoplanes sp. NPDC051494]|uniref:ABC transporter ATP-binding protein n=1 Tax=Actinoplanes sp. NPDC051494 TaxID=3363907 RepID=UPI003796AD03